MVAGVRTRPAGVCSGSDTRAEKSCQFLGSFLLAPGLTGTHGRGDADTTRFMKQLPRWIATAAFIAVSLVACGENAVLVERGVRAHLETETAARAAERPPSLATQGVDTNAMVGADS